MRELGIGLVPYSPLGRGFFAAAVDVSTLSDGDMRRSSPRFANGAAEANQPLLDAVRTVAEAAPQTRSRAESPSPERPRR
jgi:aryl-alcohol dehydrogenase-like predicted oxidoreductase